MLSRIAQSLAAGIARIITGVYNFALGLIQFPFSLLNGRQARPQPDFSPAVDPDDLLRKLQTPSPQTQAERNRVRDTVRIVMQYINATPTQRATVDLSGLPRHVRMTLLTMDSLELQTLRQAGPGAIKRFADGKSHGIPGVPVVTTQMPPRPEAVEAADHPILQRVRLKLAEQANVPLLGTPTI
jgi:hypothetical protein